MPNTFDYDGYTDSLRKTHADGMAEARKHPKQESSKTSNFEMKDGN